MQENRLFTKSKNRASRAWETLCRAQSPGDRAWEEQKLFGDRQAWSWPAGWWLMAQRVGSAATCAMKVHSLCSYCTPSTGNAGLQARKADPKLARSEPSLVPACVLSRTTQDLTYSQRIHTTDEP